MRISELAARAGVPVSAVKYYQREGLVPAGHRTSPNQADYGDTHVQRVRLIRALLDTGGLSVAATRAVIDALDSDNTSLGETFEVAQHALGAARAQEAAPPAELRERVLATAALHGWRVTDGNPGVDLAARALDGLRAVGFDAPDDYLAAYAAAAYTAASADVRALTTLPDREAITELMVAGTVLGDPLFAGMRRLAQQDVTQDLFPTPQREQDPHG